MFAHWLVNLAEDFTGRCDRAEFLKSFQIAADTSPYFMDVSCTKCDEEVARLESVSDDVVSGIDIGEKLSGNITMNFHRIDDGLSADTCDGCFRCWVDIGDENFIGSLQNFSKIVG